jgi:hypothetical protein
VQALWLALAAPIEAGATLAGAETPIEHLQLVIDKVKREKFGPRSERRQSLIDQLELLRRPRLSKTGEDVRRRATAMVRDGACSREVQLPGPREDHAAASALPRDRAALPARACWRRSWSINAPINRDKKEHSACCRTAYLYRDTSIMTRSPAPASAAEVRNPERSECAPKARASGPVGLAWP